MLLRILAQSTFLLPIMLSTFWPHWRVFSGLIQRHQDSIAQVAPIPTPAFFSPIQWTTSIAFHMVRYLFWDHRELDILQHFFSNHPEWNLCFSSLRQVLIFVPCNLLVPLCTFLLISLIFYLWTGPRSFSIHPNLFKMSLSASLNLRLCLSWMTRDWTRYLW